MATHIHTGIPTIPMRSGPGSGTIPMSIARSPIRSTAIWATSLGVGPAPEFTGGVADQIWICRSVCGC